MVAGPAATAVTVPFADTVATEVLLLFHVTFLFVAVGGFITAERVSVPFTTRLVVGLRETPVTATVAGFVGAVGPVDPVGFVESVGVGLGLGESSHPAIAHKIIAATKITPNNFLKSFI
jgi:hypothetical protein